MGQRRRGGAGGQRGLSGGREGLRESRPRRREDCGGEGLEEAGSLELPAQLVT